MRWLTAIIGVAVVIAVPSLADASSLRVVVSHLNQPKALTVTRAGNLVVALSGDGRAPSSCTNGEQSSCVDRSGKIDEVTPAGHVRTLLSGLSSVSSGGKDAQATGPAEALEVAGRLQVLFQGSVIDRRTGAEIYGPEGNELERLIGFVPGAPGRSEADFGVFEAAHDPDRGRGTDVAYGDDVPIASDPYSFAAYHGGYAVADAAGNDLLFVSRTGKVSVLAVFPTIRERAAAGTYATSQKTAIEANAQAVPDAVAVGPDGSLYVGELGGTPFDRGSSSVYRVVPGHKATVFAHGFTAIGGLAFDRQGRLLVLELDRKGLNDPGFNTGHPSSGAVIRVARDGRRTTLLSQGLIYPTGIAVGGANSIYVSNYGVSSAGVGTGGAIAKLNPD